MSELTTDGRVRFPGGTSDPLNQTGNPSSGSSTAAISRKRRYSQTRGNVAPNPNLSAPADDGLSEVQVGPTLNLSAPADGGSSEVEEIEIDDFGSGIIEYMRVCKEQIISRKMTHLDIVRRYVVWSKTPLSLFQEINLQSLFVYMDAHHPDVVWNSDQLAPSNPPVGAQNHGGVNFANPNQAPLNWLNNNPITRAPLNQGFVPVGALNPNFITSGLGVPAWTPLFSNVGTPNSVNRPVAGMTNLESTRQHQ